MRFRNWIAIGVGLVACVAVAARVLTGRPRVLPPLADLGRDWEALEPGRPTTCATGSDYRFFVRPAATDRLLVHFDGGGACWSGESCDPKGQPTASTEPAQGPPTGGIFAFGNPENPLAGYSAVVVGYCTGDLLLGDRDTSYTIPARLGRRTLHIHHRGQTNSLAVLRWVYANFPSPRVIFVTGSSAGGAAVPFYASVLARHYPHARVVALGDAAGAYDAQAVGSADVGRWGIPDVLRRHAGWEDYHGRSVPDLYIAAARAAPAIRMFQVDAALDEAQRRYIELAGTKNPDMSELLHGNRARIAGAVPQFRSFTVGGEIHVSLTGALFYTYQTGGHRLRDWVAAIEAGDTVPTVDCTDCTRPDFLYSKKDLEVIDSAIALVSAPGAWNPREGERCPEHDRPVGLTCAISRAAVRVRGAPAPWPNLPPAELDAIYAASARLGGVPLTSGPLATFNNRPGRTVADVVGLLQEIRGRILAQLNTHASPLRTGDSRG